MIKIEPLQKIGADERGATFVFDNERTGEFIVASRKAGSVSGRQYHKGNSAHKNPELLVLMTGKAMLNWKTLKETAGNIEILAEGSELVQAPALVTIPAMVWHELVGVEDFVMMEMNSLADGNNDTFRL
jgi:dTDP-4-dehydrorhamnose 3,5-epimerase-like enzyme